MEKESFFQQALSDFTSQIAYGDAVKRLADEGYSTKQILEMIDYPAPESKVEKMVFERLCETGVILLELPQTRGFLDISAKYSTKISQNKLRKDKFLSQLNKKCLENGVENSYIMLEFNFDDKDTQDMLSKLDNRQQDYIRGIFGSHKKIYHRINFTIREILYSLYGVEGFRAQCCFLKTEEIVNI